MSQQQLRKRYTQNERKAYYVGVGAAMGFMNSRHSTIKKSKVTMTKAEHESFNNGFDDFMNKKTNYNHKKNNRPP